MADIITENLKLEQARQRLVDLEQAAWDLCYQYINMPSNTLSEARRCSGTTRTREALRELAKQINFPEWSKL